MGDLVVMSIDAFKKGTDFTAPCKNSEGRAGENQWS